MTDNVDQFSAITLWLTFFLRDTVPLGNFCHHRDSILCSLFTTNSEYTAVKYTSSKKDQEKHIFENTVNMLVYDLHDMIFIYHFLLID